MESDLIFQEKKVLERLFCLWGQDLLLNEIFEYYFNESMKFLNFNLFLY